MISYFVLRSFSQLWKWYLHQETKILYIYIYIYINKNNQKYGNFTEYKNQCKFVKSEITSSKINLEKWKFLRKNTNSKHLFYYFDSATKHSQPVANLFHNNWSVILDSEKADILQQQYCFFLQKIMVNFLITLRVYPMTLCATKSLVILISQTQSIC